MEEKTTSEFIEEICLTYMISTTYRIYQIPFTHNGTFFLSTQEEGAIVQDGLKFAWQPIYFYYLFCYFCFSIPYLKLPLTSM